MTKKNKKEENETKEPKTKSVKKKHEPEISFDVYFQNLMKEKLKTLSHHKVPMRRYAEGKGLTSSATKKEFDEIFKNY